MRIFLCKCIFVTSFTRFNKQSPRSHSEKFIACTRVCNLLPAGAGALFSKPLLIPVRCKDMRICMTGVWCYRLSILSHLSCSQIRQLPLHRPHPTSEKREEREKKKTQQHLGWEVVIYYRPQQFFFRARGSNLVQVLKVEKLGGFGVGNVKFGVTVWAILSRQFEIPAV